MNLEFEKNSDGLIPAIVQNAETGAVLMLGYMNIEAYEATKHLNKVTFFSRSRQRIWTKGETSGNFLELVSMTADCDNDTLLIQANPSGPTCHTGADTCFGGEQANSHFLFQLERIIRERKDNPVPTSYISRLFTAGLNRTAQKVGEEAVETIIAAKDDNVKVFNNEAADLLFHYLILLQNKGQSLEDILCILKERHLAKIV